MNTITRIQYEKVQAGDIQPGDRVARARTHPFLTVRSAEHGATSVRLRYEDHGGSDRPRKTAQWWREVTTVTHQTAPADWQRA